MTSTQEITQDSTSRYADLLPYRVHYYEAGEGDPIVLLHGSGPGATGWSNFHLNIPELATTHRVIAVDMPGWGRGDTQTERGGRDHPANIKKLVQIMCFDEAWATDELAQLRSEATLARPDHLESWQGQPAALLVFQDFARRLAEITAPTLVVHGRDDRVVSYEASLRLVRAIPDSRLLLLNRCGHWAMIEHADEFNRAVRSFVVNH